MARYFLLLGACLLAAADALVVGGGSLATARQAASSRPLARTIRMESQEDREFKEWARNKKIAAGVDPDEDFAAGREAESKIYVVGGLITVLVPLIAGIWAYNEGYLTPQ